MNNNPLNAYRETKIKTAGQAKLIVMLYDEAIKQIEYAESYLEEDAKALDKVNNALGKAQDCITELMASLNFDKGGEIAQNLFNLYMFFNQQLMQANIDKDKKPMELVKGHLNELREAWIEADKKLKSNGGSSSGGVNIAG